MSSNVHWRDSFTREEIAELVETDDWRGWGTVLLNWGLVFGAMAIVAAWPNVFTILLALVVIGARQLGMAVIMHEASHQTLFRNRALNDWVGNWLAAYPVWADLKPYRRYHLQHHAKNWTKDDPDLDLALKFPVTRESMRRKVWRDLSGQVGWKRVKAILKRDLQGAKMKTARDDVVTWGKTASAGLVGWRNLRGVVVTNAVLFGILWAAGHPALYLLWVVAWFTTNSLVTRIRAIAEHSMPIDPTNELQNTRTTRASWWERLFIAPNRVNYHLEHHMLMTVPLHKLPRFHRMLEERGVLDEALLADGYWPILKQAASKAA